MKKAHSLLFIIIFFALCAVPLAGWVFGYKNVNAEKRALAAMPKLIDEDGINADFTIEFDDYFTDSFSFRSDFITLHAVLEDTVFSQSVSSQVIIGKDGWLFFTPTLNDYTKSDVMTDRDIYRLTRTLEIQRQALMQREIDFVFTVAPNKASVYKEYMPKRYIQVEESSNVEKLYTMLSERGFGYINLHTALSGNEIQLYHKLDTHWNNTGAMIAYDALMGKIKETNPKFEYRHYDLGDFTAVKEWQGDLGDMLFPSARLLDIQHIYDVKELYTSVRPIKSMEDLTITTTSEAGSLNVLMFRDSFANALIPIMSNEFASVTYSRATPYNYSLADAGTDAVIMEIVERNLPDLLEAAPILPVYPVSFNAEVSKEDIETAVIKAEDDGDIICISGTSVPKNYSADTFYDIYIRIATENGEIVLPAFPLPDSAQHNKPGAVQFCVRFEKSMVPDGEFTADIILFDQINYIYDSLLASSQIAPNN